jgi:hypothetical protein
MAGPGTCAFSSDGVNWNLDPDYNFCNDGYVATPPNVSAASFAGDLVPGTCQPRMVLPVGAATAKAHKKVGKRKPKK